RSPTAITRSTPPSMSTTVCRTRPVDRHLAAPTVRLASPLVIAESWSDRSTGSPSDAARVSPSTDTAKAWVTSGTRRANEGNRQSRPPSASFVESEGVLIVLLSLAAFGLVVPGGRGKAAGQPGQAGPDDVRVGWQIVRAGAVEVGDVHRAAGEQQVTGAAPGQ